MKDLNLFFADRRNLRRFTKLIPYRADSASEKIILEFYCVILQQLAPENVEFYNPLNLLVKWCAWCRGSAGLLIRECSGNRLPP
jgi:hypothetical protein